MPPRIKEDVLCAQGLVGARRRVVGGRAQCLRHVAVGLGLSDQELTSSLPEQPGELVFGWRLKRAEEEEEAAVKERRQLQKDKSLKTIITPFPTSSRLRNVTRRKTSTSNIFVRTVAEGLKPPC